jgi:hypothetical protein
VGEPPYPEGPEAVADSVDANSVLEAQVVWKVEKVLIADSVETDSVLEAQVVWNVEEVLIAPSVEELPYPIGEEAVADSMETASELGPQVV